MAKKGKNLIVVKSNNFVEASYRLTLDEMRVLLLTIGSINSRSEAHRRDFEFTVAEFAERFDTDEKSAYTQVQKAIDTLGGRWALVESTPKYDRKVTFLTEQVYFKQEGRFKIVIHQDLMPFVSEISGKFTEYNLEYIAQFNSFHSIRIYEIVSQYRNSKEQERTVLLSDLKEWLQVSDKYAQFRDFRKRVLDPAIKEINEKSDLLVSVEQIKRGRAIHALKFMISQKKHATQAVENPQLLTKDGLTKLPQRPQVKAGSQAEWDYWKECLRIRKADYDRLKAANIRRPTKLLEDLEKLFRKTGDTINADEIVNVLEKRKSNGTY